MPIEGRVASILNERDLVINRGSSDGVLEGMLFMVNQPNVPIRDPESGLALGELTREKIKVRVIEVHDKFSVAKTYETYNIPAPGGQTIAEALFHPIIVTRTRKIFAGHSQLDPVTIDIEGSTVNIGDPVFQIAEQE